MCSFTSTFKCVAIRNLDRHMLRHSEKNLCLLQDEPYWQWLSIPLLETQTLKEPICVWVVFRCSKNQISWLTPTLPFTTCGTRGSGRIGSCSTANSHKVQYCQRIFEFIYKEIFDHNSKRGNTLTYDEESDHSNKAVRKTPEIESGHKVSEEVKWT